MTTDGIRCPICNCGHSFVTHVKHREREKNGKLITITRRRRQCRYCKHNFHTTEELETLDDKQDPPSSNPYLK